MNGMSDLKEFSENYAFGREALRPRKLPPRGVSEVPSPQVQRIRIKDHASGRPAQVHAAFNAVTGTVTVRRTYAVTVAV
jgi:hypothetical protein